MLTSMRIFSTKAKTCVGRVSECLRVKIWRGTREEKAKGGSELASSRKREGRARFEDGVLHLECAQLLRDGSERAGG